jgi:hypothetical protein
MFHDTHKDSLQVDEGVWRSLVVLNNLPCQLGDVVAWNRRVGIRTGCHSFFYFSSV